MVLFVLKSTRFFNNVFNRDLIKEKFGSLLKNTNQSQHRRMAMLLPGRFAAGRGARGKEDGLTSCGTAVWQSDGRKTLGVKGLEGISVLPD